jgi:nodulation protein E
MGRRVVLTGAGTVNPLGHSVAEAEAALRAGRTAIGPLKLRDLDRLSIRVGAQVRDYDEAEHFTRSEIALLDRSTQFAVLAAREAMSQAGLTVSDALAPRAGAVLGCAMGGHATQDDSYRAVYEDRRDRVHPFVVPRLMSNAAPARLSMTYGLKGPTFTVSTACASSNHAIAQAAALIASGVADVMLSGGCEATLTFGGVKAWEGLRVMSRDTCRPFSRDRTGMVQGEGAAVLVLEAEEHARGRGAPVLAELAGWSMTSDAGDIVQPDRAGAEAAMRGAMAMAGLEPWDVGYVNAHGTGTAANDRVEAAAIRGVFGAAAPLVSSTKSMHGHCIGGTGAIELLACLMALREGIVAPTANWREADPDCLDLDVVPNEARGAEVRACLSNAFAFGGLNAVLALRAA